MLRYALLHLLMRDWVGMGAFYWSARDADRGKSVDHVRDEDGKVGRHREKVLCARGEAQRERYAKPLRNHSGTFCKLYRGLSCANRVVTQCCSTVKDEHTDDLVKFATDALRKRMVKGGSVEMLAAFERMMQQM